MQHVGELLTPQPFLQIGLVSSCSSQLSHRTAAPLRAAGGDERQRVVIRARDFIVLAERVGEAHLAHARHIDRGIGAKTTQADEFIDQFGTVARPHAERIASFVFETRIAVSSEK